MSDNNSALNVTLNGPVFGVFATLVVWACIFAIIWGMWVTKGLLFIFALLMLAVGCILFILGWSTLAFYNWAARGFKDEPEEDRWK
mgnify:CR=1 FL=1